MLTKLNMLTGLLVAALAATAIPGPMWAQTTNTLQGTWRLVSSIRVQDGKVTDQFGTGAKGMMILDAEGRFMLTIVGPNLPKFVSNSRASGTPEENKAVVAGSIAMFGRYTYDPASKTMTLRTELATFPNWNATEQRRSVITLNGDELKYATAQASGGGTATVTWRRAD